jgi:acetyl-CoA C-acetyltransferase
VNGRRPEAFIVDAVRTPVGKRGGSLAAVHSADLGAHVLSALVERTGIDPGAVDDVVMGCCDTIGSQAGDVARTSWLVAGLPDHVPGVTIDRQCGSSQQAVHFAAQGVMSGTQDLVVAGGLQNMSAIPISAAMQVGQQYGFTTPFAESPGWLARYGDQEVSQFRSAEMIAEKWEISREQMEEFALSSHTRARNAIDEGRFKNEVVPLALPDGRSFDTDECPRETSLEKMAGLKPLAPGGRITAAVASQICDASSALLVASEQAVQDHGLTPRARIHHLSVRGDDPVWMLTGPIRATRHALEKTGLSVDDIDLFECNEAFASVVLAWSRELDVPLEKVNVNGGGIALGHPIGATGTRLMATLLNELERTGGRYGLQTMCEGGGQSNVTIIERLG